MHTLHDRVVFNRVDLTKRWPHDTAKSTCTEALREWAARLEDRKPEHYVFPSEKYGKNGVPYAINAAKPIGTLKEGWEIAASVPAFSAAFTTSGTRHARVC